jgi:magnesium and cobalt transporter|tara:strand:+ start:248 stop:1060 length:813 start_codon:yes stop_codon:yes gene_type:complete
VKNIIKLLKKILFPKKETFDLVDNLRENSDLTNDQTHMLGNLLQLGNIQISDIMVPRADIVSINITNNFENTLKLFLDAGHSRLPVYKGQLDNIVGMIHVKDLLPYWHKNTEFSIEKVKRNVLFSSPAMLVSDLLGQMRATRTHLAIIVDEQGGTDGLVTIEDLVEEIVGEIEDEHDTKEKPLITALENGALLVDARTDIIDLDRALGVNFSDIDLYEDIETVGGLIFTISGKIPKINESIPEPRLGVNFKILEADHRKIHKVLVSRGET